MQRRQITFCNRSWCGWTRCHQSHAANATCNGNRNKACWPRVLAVVQPVTTRPHIHRDPVSRFVGFQERDKVDFAQSITSQLRSGRLEKLQTEILPAVDSFLFVSGGIEACKLKKDMLRSRSAGSYVKFAAFDCYAKLSQSLRMRGC